MTEPDARRTRRNRVILRKEPQPSGEILARIEEIENHGRRWFWGPEPEEVYLERLADWRADPKRDEDAMPEAGDMTDVEDRSGCDLEGMDLATYAELLQILLPGHVHGYSPSHLPSDGPTRARANSPAKDLVFRRRLRAGMDLHHPGDSKHLHTPQDS